MNEIKNYLLQISKTNFTGITERTDWEIKLALGQDGNYYGKAKTHKGMSADNYPWINTETSSFGEAIEFMKKHCERNTIG